MVQRPQDLKSSLDDKKHARESGSHAPLSPHSSFSSSSEGPPSLHRIASDRFGNRVPTPKDLYFRRHSHAVDSHQASHYSARDPPVCKRPQTVEEVIFSPLKELGDLSQGSPPSDDDSYRDPATGSLTAAWPYSKHSSLPSRSVQKRHEVKSPSHTPTSHSLASRSSSLPTSTREDLSSQNAETDPATHRTLRSEILHQRINALYYSLKNKHYDVKQRDKEIRELREEVQCLRRELARDKTQKRQRIEKRSSKSNIKVPATPASSSFSSFRPSLETTEVLCERGGKYVEEVPDAGFVVSDSSKRLKRKTQKREEHGPDGPRPHPLSPKTRSRKRSSLMRRGSPSRKENLHQDRDANKKRSETDLLYSSRMHCTRVHSVDKRKIPVEGEVHESCRNQRDVTYNAPRTTSKDAMRNVSSTEKKEAEERAPNPYSASTRIPCQQRGASNTREGSYRTSGRFHTEANGRQLEQGSMHDYYLTKDSREGEGSKKKQASEELPFIRYTAEGDGVSHSREKQSVTRKLSAERKVSSAARSMGKESHLFCSSMHEESVHSRMKQLEEEKRNLEEEATLWKETLHEALHLFVAHAPALQPYVENVLWSTIPSDIKDTKEEGGNAFSLKSIFLPEQPLHQEVRISMPANVARKEKKNRCFSHGSPEIKGSGGKSGRKEESVKNASLPCTGVESGVCGGGMTTVEDTKNIWLSGKWISHIPDAYCSSSAPVSACLEDLASCSPSPVSVQHRKRNAPAMQPSITRVTTTTKTRGESNNDVQRLRDTQRDYWIPLEVFKISQAFRDRCCPSVPITEFYAFMQQLNVIWRNRVEARMTVMKRKLEATSKKKLEALMQMEKQTAVAFAQQASKRHEEECQRWKMKLKELENAFRRLSQSGTASRFSPCDTSPSCCSADFTRPVSKRAATFSAKDAPPLPPSLPMSASLSTSVVRAARERSLKRCVEPQQHLRYCAPFSPEQENEKGGGVEAEIAGKRGSKVVQSSNVRRQPKDGVEQRMKKERTSDCTSSSGSRSRSFNEIHTNRNSIKLETAVSSMGKKLFFLNQVERRLSALRGNIFRKKRSTSSLRLLYQYDDTANTLLHTLRWNSHQGNSTCLLPPPPWSSSSSGEPHSTPRRKGRFHTGNGAVSMSLMECEIKRTSSNDRRYSKKKESRVGTTSHRRADSLSSVSSGLSSSSSSVSRHSYSPIPSSSKVRKCDAKSENQNVDALHKEAHSYYRPFPKRKQKRRKGMAEKLEKQEGSYTGQRRRLLWPLSKSESSDSERSSSSRTRSGGKKSSFRSPSYQRGKNRNSSIRVGTKEFSGHSASINGRFISPSLPSNHQGMNPNDNQPQHQTHSSAKSRPKGCSDEGQNVPQQTPECVASLSSLMASSSKSSHSLHIASIDRPLREVNPNLERLLCLVQHSCEQVQAWSSHMDLATSAATRDLVNFLTPIRSLVTKNNEENRTPVQQGVDVGKTQSPGKREISSIAEGREGNYTPPKSQSSPPIFFSTPTLHTANDSSVLTSDISALSSHRSFSLSSAACHEVLLRVIDSVLDFSEELLNTIQKASQEIHALTNTAMSEAESSMKTV